MVHWCSAQDTADRLSGLQQLMHDSECEKTIGTRRDAHPLVGDRGIARSYRIDGNELRAIRLDFAQARLNRIAVDLRRRRTS